MDIDSRCPSLVKDLKNSGAEFNATTGLRDEERRRTVNGTCKVVLDM